MKNLTILIMVIVILCTFSCKDSNINSNTDSDTEYIVSLEKTELNGAGFYISIPTDYILEKEQGPDFDMFYFYPVDTTDLESFYGGMYIGFNPSKFTINENGKTKTTTSQLFGEDIEWTIFEYEDEVFVQTITTNKYRNGSEIMIHAFGTAQSDEDLEKLFLVYSTLSEKTDL